MPLPFPEDQTARRTIDSVGQVPLSSTLDTYAARASLTFNDGLFLKGDSYLRGVGLNNNGSPLLSKDEADTKYGNGGITSFDGPVSEDYARFKSGQDTIKLQNKQTLQRGGANNAKDSWLGFGLSAAIGMLDPVTDAAGYLSGGVTKALPLTQVALAGKPALSRLINTTGDALQTAATFSAITEPIHAITDKDWSLDQAAENLGTGALLIGLMHVGGFFAGGKFTPEPRDIPKAATPKGRYTTATPPPDFVSLERGLAPQTKQAMAQAAVSRASAGKSMDPIDMLIGLDPRIVEHEAKLGGIELSTEERARVLNSMDDGTYVDPLAKVVPKVANVPEVQTKFADDLAPAPLPPASNEVLPRSDFVKPFDVPDISGKVKPDIVTRNVTEPIKNKDLATTSTKDLQDRVDYFKGQQTTFVQEEELRNVREELASRAPDTILPTDKPEGDVVDATYLPGTLQRLNRPMDGDVIDLQPMSPHDLTVRRVNALRDFIANEEKTPVPQLTFGQSPELPSEDLTIQSKGITLLLKDIESIEKGLYEQRQNNQDSIDKEAAPENNNNPTITASGVTESDSSVQAGNGFYGLGTGGKAGSIRVIKGRPTVILKKTETQEPLKKDFATLEEAKAFVQEKGLQTKFAQEAKQEETNKADKIAAKKKEEEERLRGEEKILEDTFPTKFVSYSLPTLSPETVAKTVEMQSLANEIKPWQTDNYELHTKLNQVGWGPVSNWLYVGKMDTFHVINNAGIPDEDKMMYLFNVEHDLPEYPEYGERGFSELPDEVKEILKEHRDMGKRSVGMFEKDRDLRKWISEFEHEDTRMAYYVHQLPVDPTVDFIHDFKQIRLVSHDPESVPVSSDEWAGKVFWTGIKGEIGHVHVAVIKDVAGNEVVAAFEVQGHQANYPIKGLKESTKEKKDRISKYEKDNNLPPNWEISRRLLLKAKEYADELGLPLVITDTTTASRIYRGNNDKPSIHLTESYSGYVREGIERAFPDMKVSTAQQIQGPQLWMPFSPVKEPFNGYLVPGSKLDGLTTTERVNQLEDQCKPGYNQAVSCVTRAN